ncbi:MAG: AAA family ATPase [Bacteroidota bacterium]
MKIILKKLTLLNFKGIKNLSIDFTDAIDISGDNGTGKTTIFDAFTWLLFGKDSADKKEFNIKTLNGFGHAIEKLEHEVSGTLLVNDKQIDLRRVYLEKWSPKSGVEATRLTGHETLYYYNDVPLQQKEYQAKIAEMVSEQLFKMLTNCFYFNKLNWTEQRAILTTLVPEISDAEVATLSKDFSHILELLSGKSLIEFKRTNKSRSDKLKFDLNSIPTKISENNRLLPEPTDYEIIAQQVEETKFAISEIEDEIATESEAYNKIFAENTANQKKLHALKIELDETKDQIQRDHINAVSKVKTRKLELENAINLCLDFRDVYNSRIHSFSDQIKELQARNENLRQEYANESNKTLIFPEHLFKCPTCLRTLDPSDTSSRKLKMQANFDSAQEKALLAIESEGIANNKKIDELTEKYTQAHKDYEDNENALKAANTENDLFAPNAIQSLESRFEGSQKIIDIEKDIAHINSIIIQSPSINLGTLKIEKTELQQKLDALNKIMFRKENHESITQRIEALKKEEASLAQQLADLDKLSYQVANFSKAKMELMESKINSKFSYVSFRMFDKQINGEAIEDCVALIQGVPFPDANNAAKINAGIDIINVLSAFNNVYAPIFIDNRESVNELIPCKSQIINLIVSKDKTLKIS